jgi:hypothetical protein
MSNESESVSELDTISKTPLSESIQQLFSRLRSSDVEQFISAYQLWTLHQEIDLLNLQIALTQQELLSNEEQLHLSQPTAIEQAALAQLQSSGVSDIDLLDKMHARGELWLDNALQLLEHCERLDMIQGNYTQWCEHALEGAYDWLSSIDDDDLSQAQPANLRITEPVESIHKNEADELPEELLLQKLFSDNEETISQEDLPETESELPKAPSDIGISELNVTSLDEETEVEDLPEQSEMTLTEESATTSASETELAEPETSTEPATETADESSISLELTEPETSTEPATEMAEESPINEENPNTDSFTSVSANTPPPGQELQDESEQAEDQSVHERSTYAETLDEPTEPVEHTEAFEEQTDLAEEAEEIQEQPHFAKRNRLVHRFVGRIFPKG